MLRRIIGVLCQDVLDTLWAWILIGVSLVFAVAASILFDGDAPIQERLTSAPVSSRVLCWASACIVFAFVAPLAAGIVWLVGYRLPYRAVLYARSVVERARSSSKYS